MPEPAAALRIIAVVPAHNRRETTLRFLRQWRATSRPLGDVVIVDDGSTDGTGDAVTREFPEAILLRGDGNLWWAGATNLGVEHALQAGADYILTINDDSRFEPGFLDSLLAAAREDPLRIVGPRLQHEKHPDRVVAIGSSAVFRGHRVFSLNSEGLPWSELERTLPPIVPVDTMSGNGVLIPRAAFERVGLYDAKNLPHYHADAEFVLRARAAGFRPVIATAGVVYCNVNEDRPIPPMPALATSVRSDRYWRAIWTVLHRHGPRGRRLCLFAMHYLPFLLPRPLQRWLRTRAASSLAKGAR